ncbi:hypothetical protein QBC39DRAFT_265631 [Podospora conica]|nr:hypothetical protein QBC39DRAFT_265631 [Schizothecium conicum]
MSSYDPYDAPIRERERTSKRYYREERREDRDPRYEPRDGYLSPVSHDLVPRAREDSDLSVEEIRRDFPPPGYVSRDIRRARSAGGAGHYDDYYDDRRSGHDRDREYEPRSSRKSDSYYYEEEQKKKARVLSKQEQIIAAITGAALAIGGKELYDRRDAKMHDSDIQRNMIASAALGAAGAIAGYSGTELYNKHKGKEDRKSGALTHRGRSDYSSDEEDGKEKKGSKNFLEAALAAAGLGGAVKALTGGGGKDDKSDTRSRGGSDAGSRSGKGDGANKIQKAAMASLIAGATEAFRVSKEPGGWKGEKAKRILTAAAGAATIDAAQKDGGSKLGLAESVIGGLLGNRVIHGSKKNIEEDEKTGRSRSRSRARSKSGEGGGGGGVSGLAALATAGLGALGAKKIMDGRKDDDDDDSRSRRRRSVDSRDSRDGSPKRQRSRSRSVVDKARRGLAKLGLGNAPEEEDDRDNDRRDRSRRDYDDYDDDKSSRRHRDDYDDYDRDRSHHKSSRRDDYSDEERSHHRRDRSRPRGERSERGTVARRGSASSTDLGDSDADEKHGKKMRGKQIITTGLATVATIHAAASVYQSMEKRKKRQKAVREGLLSPEEAKKLKQKAMWQDAASVGIAALGIKGAISEMQEVAEVRHEVKEWETTKEERRQRRRDRLRRRLSQLRSGESSSSSDSSSDDEKSSKRRSKGYLRQRADNWSSVGPPQADRYGDGPRYSDGNPYAALPPPPSGRSDRG